jgi:cell fate (sporulation/competence/biofilm development) regulator YlbF (YheA/YmcA/DUF963 family)
MMTSDLQLTPDLRTATESLAQNLLASEPFVTYARSSARLSSDSQARALLDRLSVAPTDVRRRQPKGEVARADIDRLRALQREAQANDVITDYANAQQAAIAYLRETNHEINQLLGVDFATLARSSCC